MIEALEQTVRDDGLEGIELELTRLRGEAYGDVVSDDFEGDLIDHFWNHRVDFPRHDARAGLHRRQVDFSEARARSGREQPQIVAGLRQLDCDALEDTR